MGMVLNGIPGHLTGTDLTNRIGMPNLWFRDNDRIMVNGDAVFSHYVTEIPGPTYFLGEGLMCGAFMAFDGELWRGT
jgi:hypothetical protein